jgi:hypothetical protein
MMKPQTKAASRSEQEPPADTTAREAELEQTGLDQRRPGRFSESGAAVSAALPPPPIAADVDLRGMEWMPLYGSRLFQSDFDAHATDAEFRAGTNLWWSAWGQVPASSLPNDDVALCRLAGLGRNQKAWRRVKNRALHGFFICSDGRFYHRALSAFAVESWGQRERKNGESDGDRTRDGTSLSPSPSASPSASPDAETGCDGTADATRRDETRRDSIEEPIGSSGKPTRALANSPQSVVDLWNEIAQRVNGELGRSEWPEARGLTKTRRTAIAALFKSFSLEDIKLALERAASDPWARGDTPRVPAHANWRFHFDHFITEKAIIKLLEKPADDGSRRPASSGNGSLERFAQGAASAAGSPLKGIFDEQ